MRDGVGLLPRLGYVMPVMADPVKVELGAVQQTLFIPLAARARETRRKRPVVRDPKAAEILASVEFDMEKYGRGWGGGVTVLRTAIFDCLVSDCASDLLPGPPTGPEPLCR